MMFNFLSSNIYVRIWKNRIKVRDVERNIEVDETTMNSFTSNRLLIGSFLNAEDLLRKLIKKINKNRITVFKPNLVLHPLEMIEGGLSQVEGRVLRELGAIFDSPEVIIHLGSELSDSEVMDKIKTNQKG